MAIPEDVAANLIADGDSYEGMPDSWVFDGTRRQYDRGVPIAAWVARAVQTGGPSPMPLLTGEGDTPMSATIALAEKLNRES
jgi:hypothetical protein